MNALDALHTRNSAANLTEPGPTPEQLGNILKAGCRANDRKHLRPWRFILIEGEAREQFGYVCLDALLKEKPALSEQEKQKILSSPLRAPTIIVVVARIRPDIKVPDVEQLLSAGGAAQMMMVAAHAQGLGAIWRTGIAAYDARVHQKLGLTQNKGDQIVGFLYIGSSQKPKELSAFKLEEIVTRWKGGDQKTF